MEEVPAEPVATPTPAPKKVVQHPLKRATMPSKQALRESYANDLSEQLDLEARLQGEAGKTRDFLEGVMAFMEKRPARYEGR